MPTSVLDALALAVTPPATFPISAASNRVAIVGTSNFHGTDASPVTAVTLGGQSMTLLAEVHVAGADVAMNIWYLLEAGIAAMSGSTLSITGLGDSTHAAVLTMSVQGALQSAPTVNSVGSTGSGGTVSLSRVVDSITLGFSGHDAPDGLTLTNPVEDLSVAVGTAYRAEAGEQAETTDNTSDFIWSHNFVRDNASIALNIAPAAAGGGPVLDPVPTTAFPGQSRTLTGTEFGATQGTGGVTIGGVAQTITAWGDTSVSFTTVLSTNSYGTGKTIELTTDAATSDSDLIELVADTAGGFGVVTMSSPNTTDESSVCFGATPTVVTGDQFEWEDFNALGNLVIGAEGFVTSVDTEGTFRGRFWDATDSTWGTVNNFTAQLPDTVGPVVNSVTVPANATYIIGQNLDFTVNWDEAATVTGTPRIALTIGGQARNATYVSGTGSTALLYRYTVQEGDQDTDGIAVGASIDLNGGTIVDAASNAATLTLNSVGATTGVLIDGIRPVISVSDLTTTNTAPTVSGSAGDAASLTLTVNAVQYNPVPSGGSWSQALPELALGTYPMTLDGTDAAGNAAVQASGTLTITDVVASAKNIGGGCIARAGSGRVWIRRH